MKSDARIVLDAWAILAYLQSEHPASERVLKAFRQAERRTVSLFASMINVGEVFYILGRRVGREAAEETVEELRRLPMRILVPDSEMILAAARLKIDHLISYADAFAAATAISLKAKLLTGDPELLQLAKLVEIGDLRRR